MGNGGWLQALDRTTATVQSAWGSGGIIIIQYDLTSKKRTFGENGTIALNTRGLKHKGCVSWGKKTTSMKMLMWEFLSMLLLINTAPMSAIVSKLRYLVPKTSTRRGG